MKLAVIDPGVFAAGVFWRHEPHLCLKAWLRGIVTPVITEDILAEYEAVLEQIAQENRFTTDTGLWLDALRESALWVEWNPKGKRVCPEFKDQILIDAALTAKCLTVITHRRDMTEWERPLGIDLDTPHEWLDKLTRRQKRLLD
jgi:predicted nucleic acid-binding protein